MREKGRKKVKAQFTRKKKIKKAEVYGKTPGGTGGIKCLLFWGRTKGTSSPTKLQALEREYWGGTPIFGSDQEGRRTPKTEKKEKAKKKLQKSQIEHRGADLKIKRKDLVSEEKRAAGTSGTFLRNARENMYQQTGKSPKTVTHEEDVGRGDVHPELEVGGMNIGNRKGDLKGG